MGFTQPLRGYSVAPRFLVQVPHSPLLLMLSLLSLGSPSLPASAFGVPAGLRDSWLLCSGGPWDPASWKGTCTTWWGFLAGGWTCLGMAWEAGEHKEQCSAGRGRLCDETQWRGSGAYGVTCSPGPSEVRQPWSILLQNMDWIFSCCTSSQVCWSKLSYLGTLHLIQDAMILCISILLYFKI